MQYIIGGYSGTPDLIVDSAIKFFEERFSRSFNFEGIVDQGYFLGIVGDISNEMNTNIEFFDNCKVFKSLYYPTIPDILKNGESNLDYDERIKNLYNDFIFGIYEKEK